MQQPITKMELGLGPTTVTTIIAGIAKAVKELGLWVQGEWNDELLGKLTNDHSTGEQINLLEQATGKKFPHLRTLLQEVVDAWRSFQRQWPSEVTYRPYKEKVEEFGRALIEEWNKYKEGEVGEIPIWNWIKANLPLIGLGAGFATLITVILFLKKK